VALAALPARIECQQNLLAWPNLTDAVTDLLDHAGTFMPEDERERRAHRTRRENHVGVTDAHSMNSDEYFACAWWIEADWLDGIGLVRFTQNCGRALHFQLSLYCRHIPFPLRLPSAPILSFWPCNCQHI
jgi:hypothetical protein